MAFGGEVGASVCGGDDAGGGGSGGDGWLQHEFLGWWCRWWLRWLDVEDSVTAFLPFFFFFSSFFF